MVVDCLSEDVSKQEPLDRRTDQVRCLRRLTFELSGAQRRGPWAARTTINKPAARPRGHAVARPLERGVRPHCALAPTRDTGSCPMCLA